MTIQEWKTERDTPKYEGWWANFNAEMNTTNESQEENDWMVCVFGKWMCGVLGFGWTIASQWLPVESSFDAACKFSFPVLLLFAAMQFGLRAIQLEPAGRAARAERRKKAGIRL